MSEVCPCPCCDRHGSISVRSFASWQSHEAPKSFPSYFYLCVPARITCSPALLCHRVLPPKIGGSFAHRLMLGRSGLKRRVHSASLLPSQDLWVCFPSSSLNSSGGWWSRGLRNLKKNDSEARRRCPHIQGWKAIPSPEMTTRSLYSMAAGARWMLVTAPKAPDSPKRSHHAFVSKSRLTAPQEKRISFSVDLCNFLWINQLHKNKIGTVASRPLAHKK